MAKAPVDNYIMPSDKAKWGFSGSAQKIEVAPEKATDAEAITDKGDEKTGRKNGGDK